MNEGEVIGVVAGCCIVGERVENTPVDMGMIPQEIQKYLGGRIGVINNLRA